MHVVFPHFRRVRIDPVLVVIERFCRPRLVSVLVLHFFIARDANPRTVERSIPHGVLLFIIAREIFVLKCNDSRHKVDSLLFHHRNEGVDVDSVARDVALLLDERVIRLKTDAAVIVLHVDDHRVEVIVFDNLFVLLDARFCHDFVRLHVDCLSVERLVSVLIVNIIWIEKPQFVQRETRIFLVSRIRNPCRIERVVFSKERERVLPFVVLGRHEISRLCRRIVRRDLTRARVQELRSIPEQTVNRIKRLRTRIQKLAPALVPVEAVNARKIALRDKHLCQREAVFV